MGHKAVGDKTAMIGVGRSDHLQIFLALPDDLVKSLMRRSNI
jgi:hypothetical protein